MTTPYDPSIVCAYLYIISKYGYPPAAANTIQYLKEMKNLGFQSIELEGIREQHLSDIYEMRHSIKYKLDDLELQVPYFCAVLPGVTSPDKKTRLNNLELFEKGCEIAKLFGAKGILDNAPLPPYQFPDEIPITRHYDEGVLGSATIPSDVIWTDFWDCLVKTYRELCDIAWVYHLTFQIHPAIGCLSSTTDGFINFQQAISRDNMRFNFDTANLFSMKENISLSFIRLSEFIDYIHLSDNTGLRVEHLPPEKGVIKWEVFFETIEKAGFQGHIGLDIGGEESPTDDLEKAYINSADWLYNYWKTRN